MNHWLDPVGGNLSQLIHQTYDLRQFLGEALQIILGNLQPCQSSESSNFIGVEHSRGLRAPMRSIDETIGSLRWQRERLVANRFANATAADALRADALGANLTTRKSDLDGLQVGHKSATGDPCDLGADTPQVFRLTAGFHHVANLGRLAANFARPRHDQTRHTRKQSELSKTIPGFSRGKKYIEIVKGINVKFVGCCPSSFGLPDPPPTSKLRIGACLNVLSTMTCEFTANPADP